MGEALASKFFAPSHFEGASRSEANTMLEELIEAASEKAANDLLVGMKKRRGKPASEEEINEAFRAAIVAIANLRKKDVIDQDTAKTVLNYLLSAFVERETTHRINKFIGSVCYSGGKNWIVW